MSPNKFEEKRNKKNCENFFSYLNLNFFQINKKFDRFQKSSKKPSLFLKENKTQK